MQKKRGKKSSSTTNSKGVIFHDEQGEEDATLKKEAWLQFAARENTFLQKR
nr:hypothetical protein Iba_scaffold14043CG0580 [Ipomoea batatas]GME19754.1 hypothetical protein Iba_scaffold23688CG0020 [Ipomoea batatas]